MNTFTVFLVLITIVCFLLIIVIMVQNPKGGGLSSTFGSSSTMGGVQKTTDFLDKSTWMLAAVLIGLILMSSISFSGNISDTKLKSIDPNRKAPSTEKAVPIAPKSIEPSATSDATSATEGVK
jgi:preprotein translocase subunit SecG